MQNFGTGSRSYFSAEYPFRPLSHFSRSICIISPGDCLQTVANVDGEEVSLLRVRRCRQIWVSADRIPSNYHHRTVMIKRVPPVAWYQNRLDWRCTSRKQYIERSKCNICFGLLIAWERKSTLSTLHASVHVLFNRCGGTGIFQARFSSFNRRFERCGTYILSKAK